MTQRKAIIRTLIGAVSLILLVVAGHYSLTQPTHSSQPTAPPGFYRVERIADGDTISVSMNGQSETIRLIGVDTPETHKPDTPVQCFGPQASDFTTSTLQGKSVRLESDPIGDNRDRYDRLLRYVYLQDGSLLQLTLIQQGYGFAYVSFPFQKKEEFSAAQAQAQQGRLGLWAACQPVENNGRWQSNTLVTPRQ